MDFTKVPDAVDIGKVAQDPEFRQYLLDEIDLEIVNQIRKQVGARLFTIEEFRRILGRK